MRNFAILFLLVAVLLTSCSSPASQSGSTGEIVKTDKGAYTNISVSELQTMLKAKDFTFVNVHIPYEGHIAQTDVFIPYDQIDQNLAKLPANKDAKIVLYCRTGHMSTIAANTLANLGYTHVYQVVGGFNAWKDSGQPLETKQP